MNRSKSIIDEAYNSRNPPFRDKNFHLQSHGSQFFPPNIVERRKRERDVRKKYRDENRGEEIHDALFIDPDGYNSMGSKRKGKYIRGERMEHTTTSMEACV